MTDTAHLIGGMWGTTNLRLWLMRAGDGSDMPEILDSISGPGAAETENFEETFFSLTTPWLNDLERPAILLAGMVGSTIGWRDVPYIECPAAPMPVCHSFEARGQGISIVPGFSCADEHGRRDLMRGEETEAAGWLSLDKARQSGRHLLVIPGTHTKWVEVKNGVVVRFLTSVTGEMFAGFRKSGVIVPANIDLAEEPGPAFLDAASQSLKGGSLLHDIFSIRARRVIAGDSDADAAERLSGLLIGADVRGAMELFRLRDGFDSLTILGSAQTLPRYRAALSLMGIEAVPLAAETAAIAGLWAIAREGGLLDAQ